MAIFENVHTIIWDWNGTLLNDIDLCIELINRLLHKRNLSLLNAERYREIFSFPVKDYYEKVGFDFRQEPFEIPAQEFIDMYNAEVAQCKLHQGAKDILCLFHEKGKKQIILSAMEQNILESTLHQHQIFKYFDEVSGLDNHYAASKLDNGKNLIGRLQLNPTEVCLIGDTVHDFEVARAIGCKCILIADGHQSEKRLLETGSITLNRLQKLVEVIFQER